MCDHEPECINVSARQLSEFRCSLRSYRGIRYARSVQGATLRRGHGSLEPRALPAGAYDGAARAVSETSFCAYDSAFTTKLLPKTALLATLRKLYAYFKYRMAVFD